MNQDQLPQFLDNIKGMDVEKIVLLYVKTREKKSEVQRELDAKKSRFDQIMDRCEAVMLERATEQGVDGFKTQYGSTYTATTSKISIADDNAFFTFVKELGDLDFFERRVSSSHVAEWMKENGDVLPPGLNQFRERVMRVRKASEK
jgi:hypothetical protein